jgi:uroporphyrinogen decarboxylase
MTSRERMLALYAGEKPDRIPVDYWATAEVTQRLMKDLGYTRWEDLAKRFHLDLGAGAEAPHKTGRHPDDPEADIWGTRHQSISYGTGEYGEVSSHPLAEAQTVEDIHAFQWPTADDHDYEIYRERLKELPGDRAVSVGSYEPFSIYCKMRGMEQALMDLLVEPEMAEAALGHIFDYHYQLNARMFEMGQGRIDTTVVAEDLGSQQGLMMGIEQIRRFILPNMKKMADLARSFGIHIFHHDDGAIREVIPDLIDVVGIEVLNPVQWRCPGMEREGLVRDFGDKLIFHGAVDNQQTLAFGSVQDVRDEVLDNIRIFSSTRWVCAPCHNIQAVSPTENIVAMYDTIYENGKLLFL